MVENFNLPFLITFRKNIILCDLTLKKLCNFILNKKIEKLLYIFLIRLYYFKNLCLYHTLKIFYILFH